MKASKQIENLLEVKGRKTVAVVDLQWGDVGKGKIVDMLAGWADIIARGTGGANAGHTIEISRKTYVFHLIPAGILWDEYSKMNIIGNGVALDPRILSDELELLRANGKSYNNLLIAYNAHLVLPQHIALDRLRENGAGVGKIGTTGRGIGPVYEDHVARLGLTANDLLNVDSFIRKLRRNLSEKISRFARFDPDHVREVMFSDALEGGIYYDPKEIISVDAVINRYGQFAKNFSEMIWDTDALLQRNAGIKNILLEGAQGVLLSVDYGTYPFVTSSDCSLAGLAKGVGLRTDSIDYPLGIAKAFYMTRVGGGPFPTEMGGQASEDWCNSADANKVHEGKKYPFALASIQSSDPFLQGIAIRKAGNEYGATTGRPRRVGWFDLPLLRYATKFGSKRIALTKLDVLSECETIKICHAYSYVGPTRRVAEKTILGGERVDEAMVYTDVIGHCVPRYAEFSGWQCDISGIRKYSDLPKKLINIVNYIEGIANVIVDMISVGPDREQIIIR